jgi:cytosine/creatinine deaminase
MDVGPLARIRNAARDVSSPWPETLPARVWLADAHVPAALRGEGGGPLARVSLLLEHGRISALASRPEGDAPVLALDGATVLSAFVDPHTHLDKGDLLACGLPCERDLFCAIDAVKADYRLWTAHELHTRIGFALRTAYAHGTRALLSYCDWSAPDGPLAWRVLLEQRAAWRGRVQLIPASLACIDVLADAQQAQALGRAVAAAGGVLGLFAYPAPHVAALVRTAFSLAQRFELTLDFHVDEHLEPPLSNLSAIAQVAQETGWGARTICGHACRLSAMPDDESARTLDALAVADVALVALPNTNLFLQDSTAQGPRRAPQRRGLLPLHQARQRGVALAIGSDNHRDVFFPAGDLDPLQTLALTALAAQLDDPVALWADTITSTPARRLGLAWDGVLRPGAPADLVLHPGRNSTEVMARCALGRMVLRAGQPLDAAAAQLPDFRELDGLRNQALAA